MFVLTLPLGLTHVDVAVNNGGLMKFVKTTEYQIMYQVIIPTTQNIIVVVVGKGKAVVCN